MRIFHFINTPFSIDQLQTGGKQVNSGGGWAAALVGGMFVKTDFKFACAAFGNSSKLQCTSNDRIDSFVMPQGKGENGASLDRLLRKCGDLVNEWKPDLIHIHGTEGLFGLLTARGIVNYPAVISLQGLLGPCSEWYRYFGNRSLMDIFRMHWLPEIPLLRGQWIMFRNIRNNAKREREIIAGNRHFMGRTEWDRAYVRAHNPSAAYYHEGRMIREPFWRNEWKIEDMKRHRVIFTNARHPRKGAELLLDAAKLLQSDYPDIQVCIAGGIPSRTGYGRYIRKKISEASNIVELGALNAEQMTAELTKSHVFVSPSYIDNSPNAVSEAQLVGMPVISTYTGGVPSLIEDGRTGLFFPTGDAPMLAARLRQVFENDALAIQLGNQSHETAARRHEPDTVIRGIVKIYEDVLSKSL